MAIKRKRKFNTVILILLLFIVLVSAAFAAKLVYNKLREPNRYVSNGQIPFITPRSSSPGSQVVSPKEPGTKALLPGAKWVAQTFNNCGPATTSMVLQYFGFNVNQNETKARLRSNPDDKNVFTYEIAEYLQKDYQIKSQLLYGGDLQTLKKLLTNGFYVVIEDWLHPNEDIGHTTIIRGFDDEQGVLIADDSFIGINITYPYEQFVETQWKAFNYEYLPVYKPEDEALIQAILGNTDKTSVFQRSAQIARREIAKNENDMYAWFNLGSSLYELGQYTEAKAAFEKSKSLGWPKRMLWYQIQPIQTYNALHEYQKTIEMADIAMWGNNVTFAEAHFEKAVAYKGLGNIDKAREEVNSALQYDPNFEKAKDLLGLYETN